MFGIVFRISNRKKPIESAGCDYVYYVYYYYILYKYIYVGYAYTSLFSVSPFQRVCVHNLKKYCQHSHIVNTHSFQSHN